MGDPVGIGPEIIIKALSHASIYDLCRPLVLGDAKVLKETSLRLSSNLRINIIESVDDGGYRHGDIDVLNLSDLDPKSLKLGHSTLDTGRAMVRYIMKAIDLAMAGVIDAVTTAPINKLSMRRAGFCFEGHTEILARRTDTSRYVMMLAGEKLRVALVTAHCPLSAVADRLSVEGILSTIEVTDNALRTRFGITRPRIAVAALNPHGGEGGLFGKEEDQIIYPSVRMAKGAGINVLGPLPSDTLFYYALKGSYDAVVCMYHDQGLIPFKMVHFADGVNVTLGLPIIRTSVDHGTAYDIAGTGRADPRSMIAAIRMAAAHAATSTNSTL